MGKIKSKIKSIKKTLVLNMISWYPPYWGTGICVKRQGPDQLNFHVSMKHRFYNTNYVGVHFGGSLYSMADPFFMLILMEKLGTSYLVWDKSAKIHFKRPGTGIVSTLFKIDEDQVGRIREIVEREGKYEPMFTAEIKNEKGVVVAVVEKTLWVKKKS